MAESFDSECTSACRPSQSTKHPALLAPPIPMQRYLADHQASLPAPPSPCSDIWLITKHRDLVDVLSDQRFSKAGTDTFFVLWEAVHGAVGGQCMAWTVHGMNGAWMPRRASAHDVHMHRAQHACAAQHACLARLHEGTDKRLPNQACHACRCARTKISRSWSRAPRRLWRGASPPSWTVSTLPFFCSCWVVLMLDRGHVQREAKSEHGPMPCTWRS